MSDIGLIVILCFLRGASSPLVGLRPMWCTRMSTQLYLYALCIFCQIYPNAIP